MSQPLVKLRRYPSLISVIISLLLVSIYATSEYRQVLRRQRLDVPVTIVFVLIAAFFLFVEPIAQPQAYHNFADRRRCVCRCGGGGVPRMMFLPPDYQHDESGDKSAKTRNGGIAFPNFGDTASNIVILLGGICGVISLMALEVLGTAKGATAGERSPSEEWQLNTCLPHLLFGDSGRVSWFDVLSLESHQCDLGMGPSTNDGCLCSHILLHAG